MVLHESFSTASRVGVSVAMEGWMGSECAILGTEIGGDREKRKSWFFIVLQRIFV